MLVTAGGGFGAGFLFWNGSPSLAYCLSGSEVILIFGALRTNPRVVLRFGVFLSLGLFLIFFRGGGGFRVAVLPNYTTTTELR